MLKRKKDRQNGRRQVSLATLEDTRKAKANILEFQSLEDTFFSLNKEKLKH